MEICRYLKPWHANVLVLTFYHLQAMGKTALVRIYIYIYIWCLVTVFFAVCFCFNENFYWMIFFSRFFFNCQWCFYVSELSTLSFSNFIFLISQKRQSSMFLILTGLWIFNRYRHRLIRKISKSHWSTQCQLDLI